MIVVDKDKCIGCGNCARVCHEQCISLVQKNGTKMAHVDHELCSTCTQCIAICSQQALTWDRVTAVPHNKSQLPSAVQLEELLRQRRTVRLYRNRKIDRVLVEKIVNCGTYAPTNNYNLRAIVVDDLVVIEAFDRINSAGPLLLDRSREARKLLSLQKGEHILATLDLGYPALQFKNKVEGKQMPIAWVGGERNGR